MEKIIINGGNKLHGQVKISGAKNAAVAIIPAVILSDGVCRIENVPDIQDVNLIAQILFEMGASVKRLDKSTLEIDPKGIREPVATYVVPRRGNEVEGEGYDFIAETEETEEEEEEYYDDYVVLNSIGILYIDSINLRYSVWDEASQVSLRYGLGHYEDSVMPGQDGNATILGHNYRDGSMFHKLGNLSIGDEVIFIDLNGNEYYYYVVSSDIVSADDILDYALGNVTDSKRLTLITCTYEYGMTGWRRVVICEPG